jgi:hypothetical protein
MTAAELVSLFVFAFVVLAGANARKCEQSQKRKVPRA